MKAWYPFFKNPIKWFQLKFKWRRLRKQNAKLGNDVARGVTILQIIDKHIVKENYSKQKQKQFWRDFVKNPVSRKSVYRTIKDALIAEEQYFRCPWCGQKKSENT